ncbi:MAG: RNA polymerase sigma factor [Ktedonobacterales bacterium]
MIATASKTTTTPDTTDTATEPTLTYEQLYTDCWKYCRGIVTWKANGIDSDTIDDLVSDSFVSLWRLWSAVNGQPAKMQKAYLGRIVANRVNDYLRRLRLERATLVTEGELEAALSHDDGGTDADAISVLAYLASGEAVTTESPERIYLAREALREALDGCIIGVHRDDDPTYTKQIQQAMLAEAMGYTLVSIAHVQGHTKSALVMRMLRARERIGAREPSYATAPVRTHKQAQEVAA